MAYGLLYDRSAAEASQPQKKQEKEVKNQKDREKKEKEAIKKFKVSKQNMHIVLIINQLSRFTLLVQGDYKELFTWFVHSSDNTAPAGYSSGKS